MNRKEHWEGIYKDKSPSDVSWYQQEPSLSLALIKKLAQDKSEDIIDIGGGASTLSDHLLQDGFKNITVLDLSSNALSHAKQRLGDKSTKINWIEEDITHFVSEHPYALWHDRAVFHFLTDISDRKKYKQTLETSVKPGGHVIIAAFSTDGPKKCSGLDIVQYDAEKLQKELGPNFKLIDQRLEKHMTPTRTEQAFGYYVFTKKGITANSGRRQVDTSRDTP